MARSIRIISDGTPNGTKVFDIKSGEEITGIRSIEWKVGVGKAATTKIEFVVPVIDVIADLEGEV
jgi:hypothetical protein